MNPSWDLISEFTSPRLSHVGRCEPSCSWEEQEHHPQSCTWRQKHANQFPIPTLAVLGVRLISAWASLSPGVCLWPCHSVIERCGCLWPCHSVIKRCGFEHIHHIPGGVTENEGPLIPPFQGLQSLLSASGPKAAIPSHGTHGVQHPLPNTQGRPKVLTQQKMRHFQVQSLCLSILIHWDRMSSMVHLALVSLCWFWGG